MRHPRFIQPLPNVIPCDPVTLSYDVILGDDVILNAPVIPNAPVILSDSVILSEAKDLLFSSCAEGPIRFWSEPDSSLRPSKLRTSSE